MPTRNEVFRVADKLRAAGKRPSYRMVTEALPRGGSPQVVLKYMEAWREERAYKPKLEAKGLPEPLQERLVAFAEQTWRAAQEQAATVFQREREAMEETRLAEAEDRECLLGQLEASRADVDGLRDLGARPSNGFACRDWHGDFDGQMVCCGFNSWPVPVSGGYGRCRSSPIRSGLDRDRGAGTVGSLWPA